MRKREKTVVEEESAAADQEEMLELQQATMEGAEDAALAFRQVDEEFLADIKAQEDALLQEVPNFSLTEEMEKNPLFATMLACGEQLLDVFHYFHPEVLAERMEKDMVKQIQARKRRPRVVAQTGAKDSGVNIDQLNEEQMAEIDRRVRRGERVTF